MMIMMMIMMMVKRVDSVGIDVMMMMTTSSRVKIILTTLSRLDRLVVSAKRCG